MNSRSDTDDPGNRRLFSRVDFNTRTVLNQGANRWEVELADLSLKGLLIATPADWQADREIPFTATITLDDEVQIIMRLRWRHSHRGRTGFYCDHIDIDSITHLRKLVELNLGDAELLERELAALGE